MNETSGHLPECMTPDDPCAEPDRCDSMACARDRLHLTLRDEADKREGHLPECDLAKQCRFNPEHDVDGVCLHCGEWCGCDMLRACEARVTARHNAEHDDDRFAAFQNGYAAALSAARDAVVEEFGPPRLHPGWQTCSDRDHFCYLLQDALAAIDARRGE